MEFPRGARMEVGACEISVSTGMVRWYCFLWRCAIHRARYHQEHNSRDHHTGGASERSEAQQCKV